MRDISDALSPFQSLYGCPRWLALAAFAMMSFSSFISIKGGYILSTRLVLLKVEVSWNRRKRRLRVRRRKINSEGSDKRLDYWNLVIDLAVERAWVCKRTLPTASQQNRLSGLNGRSVECLMHCRCDGLCTASPNW